MREFVGVGTAERCTGITYLYYAFGRANPFVVAFMAQAAEAQKEPAPIRKPDHNQARKELVNAKPIDTLPDGVRGTRLVR